MQRRCCCPPESPSADVCSRSLTSSQSAERAQSLLDPLRQLRAPAEPVDLQPVRHVLEDGLREGVGLLKHHADPPPQVHDVRPRPVDVVPVEEDLSLHAGVRDDVVHAVQAAQEGGLPAAGRADEGRDGLLRDRERDFMEGLVLAVEKGERVRVSIRTFALRRKRAGGRRRGCADLRSRNRRRARFDHGRRSFHHVRCILSRRRVTTLARTEKMKMNATSTSAPAQACRCQSSIGRDRVRVHLHGQRRDRLIEARREEPVVERREEQRRRFARDARERQQDARHDAGQRGREPRRRIRRVRGSRRARARPREGEAGTSAAAPRSCA